MTETPKSKGENKEAPSRRVRREGSGAPAESASEGFGAVHDARSEEDHKLVPGVARAPTLEENAEDRDVAEEGDLIQVSTGISGVNTTDYRSVTVLDEQVGLGFALEDGRVATGRRLV